MFIIDIETDTIIQNFNVNPGTTKYLSKVAWDLYLVPGRRVSFKLTDSLELLRGSLITIPTGQKDTRIN
jgi:hypothetical protein